MPSDLPPAAPKILDNATKERLALIVGGSMITISEVLKQREKEGLPTYYSPHVSSHMLSIGTLVKDKGVDIFNGNAAYSFLDSVEKFGLDVKAKKSLPDDINSLKTLEVLFEQLTTSLEQLVSLDRLGPRATSNRYFLIYQASLTALEGLRVKILFLNEQLPEQLIK